MTDHARPFDTGRVRPLVTTLDTLRTSIDDDSFDAVILSLDAVAADLGDGDVCPLPGSVAWIDRLRRARQAHPRDHAGAERLCARARRDRRPG